MNFLYEKGIILWILIVCVFLFKLYRIRFYENVFFHSKNESLNVFKKYCFLKKMYNERLHKHRDPKFSMENST